MLYINKRGKKKKEEYNPENWLLKIHNMLKIIKNFHYTEKKVLISTLLHHSFFLYDRPLFFFSKLF